MFGVSCSLFQLYTLEFKVSTLSIHDLHTYDLGMSGMKEFGALIKRAREQRGLTQAELGARIGYTHSFVVRLERGQMTNPPTPQTMRDLERELGVSRREMLEAAGYLDDDVEHDEAGLEEFHARLDPLLVGLDEYDLDAVLDAATAMANASRRRRERTHGSPQPVDASGSSQ